MTEYDLPRGGAREVYMLRGDPRFVWPHDVIMDREFAYYTDHFSYVLGRIDIKTGEAKEMPFPLPEGAEGFGQGGGQGAGPASGEWTTTGPALDVVAEDNLRTMPLSVAGDQAWPQNTNMEPTSARVAIAEQVLARQMAQLVAEAKQQLQDAIRESAAQTVSEEAQPLLAAPTPRSSRSGRRAARGP